MGRQSAPGDSSADVCVCLHELDLRNQCCNEPIPCHPVTSRSTDYDVETTGRKGEKRTESMSADMPVTSGNLLSLEKGLHEFCTCATNGSQIPVFLVNMLSQNRS